MTFQGDSPSEDVYYIGTKGKDVSEKAFAAADGNVYLEQQIDSKIQYGQGNDNYAEFAGDGATRVRAYSITVPELVLGVNANPAFRSAYAVARVVDGMGLGLSIAGDSQVIEVGINQSRSVEITPRDPYGFTKLNNRDKSPYKLDWVTPGGAYSPHSAIVNAISFRATFDDTLSSWRYFLDIDGPALSQVGKYIVYFHLEETDPRTVQYRSQVEGVITSRVARYLRATLTVSYGLDQCAKPAVVIAPDMIDTISRYQTYVAALESAAKKITRKGRAKNSPSFKKNRKIFKAKLAVTKTLLAKASQMNSDVLSHDLASVSSEATQVALSDLLSTALLMSGGGPRTKDSPRVLFNVVKRLLDSAGLDTKLSSRIKKKNRKIKIAFDQAGVIGFFQYKQGIEAAQSAAEQARGIAARCSALPGARA